MVSQVHDSTDSKTSSSTAHDTQHAKPAASAALGLDDSDISKYLPMCMQEDLQGPGVDNSGLVQAFKDMMPPDGAKTSSFFPLSAPLGGGAKLSNSMLQLPGGAFAMENLVSTGMPTEKIQANGAKWNSSASLESDPIITETRVPMISKGFGATGDNGTMAWNGAPTITSQATNASGATPRGGTSGQMLVNELSPTALQILTTRLNLNDYFACEKYLLNYETLHGRENARKMINETLALRDAPQESFNAGPGVYGQASLAGLQQAQAREQEMLRLLMQRQNGQRAPVNNVYLNPQGLAAAQNGALAAMALNANGNNTPRTGRGVAIRTEPVNGYYPKPGNNGLGVLQQVNGLSQNQIAQLANLAQQRNANLARADNIARAELMAHAQQLNMLQNQELLKQAAIQQQVARLRAEAGITPDVLARMQHENLARQQAQHRLLSSVSAMNLLQGQVDVNAAMRPQAYAGLRPGARTAMPGFNGMGQPMNGLNGVGPLRPTTLPGHQINMPPGARGNQF
eukprot:jgi/Botrbrau1/16877/Bobra.150_2s0095.2